MFKLSVVVDFPDDVIKMAFDKAQLAAMMRYLKRWGFQRVYWSDYGRPYYGDWGSCPSIDRHIVRTEAAVGEILKAAVEAAKAEGLEIYAWLKPFEGGSNYDPSGRGEKIDDPRLNPLGLYAYGSMRFLRENAHLRLKHRQAHLLEESRGRRIARIDIRAHDRAVIESPRERVRLYTSADNYDYQPLAGGYRVELLDEPDENGKTRTVLRFSGLAIDVPFVMFVTESAGGAISNTHAEIVRVYDPGGNAIPSTPAFNFHAGPSLRRTRALFNHGMGGAWNADADGINLAFQKKLLPFDGWNMLFAVALGVDPYISGALCPSEPGARKVWLDWTRECLDAGVDGIDFRPSAHISPFNIDDYGFNPPVVEEYKRRHGVDILTQPHDKNLKRAILGDGYTQFLREAAALIRARGAKVQHHLGAEELKLSTLEGHDLQHFGIQWQWERWIAEGLVDEWTLGQWGSWWRWEPGIELLRSRAPDARYHYRVWHSTARGTGGSAQPARYEILRDQIAWSRRDPRAAGYMVYESEILFDCRDGELVPAYPEIGELFASKAIKEETNMSRQGKPVEEGREEDRTEIF